MTGWLVLVDRPVDVGPSSVQLRIRLINGIVTSDKFCMSCSVQLHLTWPHKPWRHARLLSVSAYPPALPLQEDTMNRTWQVHRDGVPHPDGQRRGDRAYQLLLQWADQAAVHSCQPLRRTIMRIAVYARVSTPHQHLTHTIEQQLARLRAYVLTQPTWSLAQEHIFCDDGYSGAQLKRPGLDHLRDQAAQAAFDLVLITAPDRLARNYVHQMVVLEELTQCGCPVQVLDRPMSDDPHDQLVLQI